jgi:hypothetical protein
MPANNTATTGIVDQPTIFVKLDVCILFSTAR